MVEAYLGALSRADADTAVSLVAEDFVNEHTSELGEGLDGRAAYARRLPGFLAQFPGLHYEIVDVLVDGDRAAARYRMTATYDGHAIDIPGVMLFRVDDGLIAHRTDVWDSLTFLRQIGAAEAG
ncbi:MAG: SnoaL-like domain-containing protein [Ilumatobacter sp.]|nr:SnoaL-like domain-containing protein [Ilumatobacter sp.]